MDFSRRSLFIGGGVALAGAAVGGGALFGPRLFGEPASAPKTLPPMAALSEPVPARLASPAVQTRAAADVKRLFLHNLHTGETTKAVYWENGAYVDGALAEVRHALRDWRNGEQHPMDPKLFDVFHDLTARLDVERPIQVVCGYRSPATNAMLHARSSEVAKHSLHLEGKATDLRIEGVDLVHLRKAALSLRRGGVGFYPVSDFVHVDTGPVRQWSGA